MPLTCRSRGDKRYGRRAVRGRVGYNAGMQRWLSRFSFPLLVVGGLLFYQAYLGSSGRAERLATWQVTLLLIGGACAMSLGLRGIRDRHRGNDS